MKLTQLLTLVLLLSSCRQNLQLEENAGGLLPSELSNKPIIFKLSYTEESQRKSEFTEGAAEKYGLTYLEEPKSERKEVYLEVYYDFSIGKQIEYLTPNSDFPADKWQLPKDMPKLKKTIYLDGVVKGYDANGTLIFEDTYNQDYWLDPTEFANVEEAQKFAIAAYYNPTSVASKMIEMAIEGADGNAELSDQVLVFTQNIEDNSYPAAKDAGNSNLEVTNEKLYMLADYGVVFRTEGYLPNGEMKDMEHKFYTFNEDSVLYVKSSHYINKQHSNAYDITFTEYSDIFYENFKIETSLDY